ncbi:H(+)-transporting V0 sector ATPase subunit e, partial [Dispira simplex]
MSGFLVLLVGAIFAGLCAASYFLVPKSWDQTLWRTCLIMTLVCVYMMWSVTYMAQLHPLIQPR